MAQVGPGRPTLRTPEIEGVLRRALAKGMGYKWAAQLAGIAESTLREWRREDPAFGIALAQIDAGPAETAWGTITRASEEDWKAAAYLCEKRYAPQPEVDDEAVADLAARLHAYDDAMRATVPEPPAANGGVPT